MINLVNWAQADGLLYFMVGILLLIPIVVIIWLVSMTLKNRKKKQLES